MSDTVGLFRFGDDGKLAFNCPGCEYPHVIAVSMLGGGPGIWTWDGDPEKPTVRPSLLCSTPGDTEDGIAPTRCHLDLVAGKIQFLGDCAHALAGQTVDPLPLSLYYGEEEAA